jgi:AcrR family transcriptional regulator
MSVKPVARKTGRPAKVPGEKGTKEKIFDAAIELFAERGYDGVSVRDIARAVGLTEGAVYRHYASKEDILNSIFAYVENRLYAQQAPGSVDELVDAMSFREILESMPRFMMADPYMNKISRIMIFEMNHNEKIRDYFVREMFERPVDETEALFRKLAEKGKIKPCDMRALSSLYISFLVSWFFRMYILCSGGTPEPDSVEETMQAQIDLFVDLLEPETGRK